MVDFIFFLFLVDNGGRFRNPHRVYEDEEENGRRVLSEVAETYKGNSARYLAYEDSLNT